MKSRRYQPEPTLRSRFRRPLVERPTTTFNAGGQRSESPSLCRRGSGLVPGLKRSGFTEADPALVCRPSDFPA